jgi:hypothetical protein
MPIQLGLPRASATAIQTIMLIIMFTIGISIRMNHHKGFLAIISMRKTLSIGEPCKPTIFRIRLLGDFHQADGKIDIEYSDKNEVNNPNSSSSGLHLLVITFHSFHPLS